VYADDPWPMAARRPRPGFSQGSLRPSHGRLDLLDERGGSRAGTTCNPRAGDSSTRWNGARPGPRGPAATADGPSDDIPPAAAAAAAVVVRTRPAPSRRPFSSTTVADRPRQQAGGGRGGRTATGPGVGGASVVGTESNRARTPDRAPEPRRRRGSAPPSVYTDLDPRRRAIPPPGPTSSGADGCPSAFLGRAGSSTRACNRLALSPPSRLSPSSRLDGGDSWAKGAPIGSASNDRRGAGSAWHNR